MEKSIGPLTVTTLYHIHILEAGVDSPFAAITASALGRLSTRWSVPVGFCAHVFGKTFVRSDIDAGGEGLAHHLHSRSSQSF